LVDLFSQDSTAQANELREQLEERDIALGEYLRQDSGKGIPNPFMVELWKGDTYYLKVKAAQ
jgi:hypothetical protein